MGLRLNRLFGPVDRMVCLAEPVDLDRFLEQFRETWNPQSIASLRSKIARAMVGEDEIWDCHTSGFQDRRGLRGLAIVRRGRVMKVWWIWKS